MSSSITLITRENVEIVKNKAIICSIFSFFNDYCDDHPNETMIELRQNLEDWTLLDLFTSVLVVPDNKEDWIKLITAAEFFNLVPRYSTILRKEAKKFALAQGATIKEPKKITLLEISKKIEDPTYLLLSERRCEYVFTRGVRRGDRCGAPVVEDKYCASCIKKKPVMSRSSAQTSESPEPRDPSTLLTEQRCEWIFVSGPRIGRYCGAPVVPNERYCASCITKKSLDPRCINTSSSGEEPTI